MLGKESQQIVAMRHLEIPELESRRDRAPDQRVLPTTAGGLPDAAGHDDLRRLAQTEVAAEAQVAGRATVVAHRKLERRAVIVMPDLVGIDPVPMRALAGLQQEEDRGAMRQ